MRKQQISSLFKLITRIPLSEKQNLEAGLRMQINENRKQQRNVQPGKQTVDLPKIPERQQSIRTSNKVYAAYATITSAIKNFGYEVGLRAESSNYHGRAYQHGRKIQQQLSDQYVPIRVLKPEA
jgi:hypothetical protein